MLVVTDNAATAIRELVEDSQFDAEAGLRFSIDAAENDEAQLNVSLAPIQAEDDECIDAAGAHVFLDRIAAAVLADKILHAGMTETGEIGFSFAEQGSPN